MYSNRTPRTTRAGRRSSRWRQSRGFNIFVIVTLLISAVLLALVLLQREADTSSSQGELSGDAVATFALLDVGQALSAAIVTDDGYSLVYDFGLTQSNTEDVILPFLEEHRVSEIDYAILSHPHQDHVGGLPALLESMPIATYIDPVLETTNQTYAQSLEMIEERDIHAEIARQGDTYSLGEHVDLEILWPTDDLLIDSDGSHRLNDNSTVVRVDIGDVSILLTGDIERDAEDILVDTMAVNLDVDILQVGHHGSNTSSQDHFLAASSPALAAIPVGQDNQYGHPHGEVMQRLRQHNIQIYRTDVDGTVIIQTDGESWDVTTTRTGQSWTDIRSSLRWIGSNWTAMATSSPSWFSMMGSN
jgi:competence protein ComEC